MAVTVGDFTAIDDSQIDAESPITESLVTALRDNAYWVNAGTQKTSETTANKLLRTSGSNDLEWVNQDDVGGVEGTKGALSFKPGSKATISIISNRKLMVSLSGAAGQMTGEVVMTTLFIDSSDDSYAFNGFYNSFSSSDSESSISGFGIVSTTDISVSPNRKIVFKKNGSDYDFGSSILSNLSYMWL